MSDMESVVVRLTETGEYDVFLRSSVAADIEDAVLRGASLGYEVIASRLSLTEAWSVVAVLNAMREGGFVLVTKWSLTEVDQEKACWTLNACAAIARQAGMSDLAETFEEIRGLL